MAYSTSVWTYFDDHWRPANTLILGAADHAAWLGSMVFDGARRFEGVTPDLMRHCERIIDSARVLDLYSPVTAQQIFDLTHEGLANFAADAAVYIRPMIWAREPGTGFVCPEPNSTAFCLCLEETPMLAPEHGATLTTTRFRRPTLDSATVNAKASCLYPNNARMLREANDKGFSNALVADQLGNVAETATANIFMVKDSEIFTPVPNGTFLNGITRQRHIRLLREAGRTVHETTLSFDDFRTADEVFMTGNVFKITPVTAFDDVNYQAGPVTRAARELYWDWAKSER